MEILRTTTNTDEIKFLLNGVNIDGDAKTSIWQKVENVKSELLEPDLVNIDSHQLSLFLTKKQLKKIQKNQEITCYINGPKYSLMFTQVFNIQSNHLLAEIPKKICLYEKRNEPRILLEISDFNQARIIKNEQLLSFRMLDISVNGISILVSPEHIESFKNDEQILIDEIFKFSFIEKIRGKIIYSKLIETDPRIPFCGYYRVGIQLQKPIPDIAWEEIIKTTLHRP